MKEPQYKRATIFVDGQNLYHAARRVFGFNSPNYDIARLSREVCRAGGWHLVSAPFYTGIPAKSRDPYLYDFWNAKLLFMGRQRIRVFSRPLRYSKQKVVLRDSNVKKSMCRARKAWTSASLWMSSTARGKTSTMWR